MSHDAQLADHERRISSLQNDVTLLTHQSTLLTHVVKTLETQGEKLAGVVRQAELALASARHCPDPGACLRLRTELETVTERVTRLELERSKLLGMFIVLGTLATTVISLAVSWISSFWK